MALSGSFTGTTANSLITPTITWSATQSIDGNYSDVTATLRYSRTNTGYTTDGKWNGTLTINGDTKTVSDYYISISYNSDTVAISHTARVYHNSDGTKSITISATGYQPSTTLKSTTISGTVTLDTIPRASSISAPNFTIGAKGNITVTKASSGFVHTITYSFKATDGSTKSGTICTKSSATTVSWTPPTSLNSAITVGDYAALTLTVTTYTSSSATSAVGSKSAPSRLYVQQGVDPTISGVSLTIVNDNATINGWGVAVKGYSKLRFSVSASGASGSTITGYSVTVNGQTFTTESGTTTLLVADGSTKASVRVTDSRGRHAWADSNVITVYDYANPSISSSNAQRCDSASAVSDSGTYALCTISAGCSSCGGHNTVSTRARYKQRGAANYGSYTAITNNGSTRIGGSFTATSTWEVELSAVDALGKSSPAVVYTLATESVAFNLKDGGKAAAFGKYAEEPNTLEVAPDWDVSVGGSLTVGGGTAANHFLVGSGTGNPLVEKSPDEVRSLLGAATVAYAKSCFLPNGQYLSITGAADLDGVHQNGCFRLSSNPQIYINEQRVDMLMCFVVNDSTAVQFALSYDGRLQVRSCWYGTWYRWRLIVV